MASPQAIPRGDLEPAVHQAQSNLSPAFRSALFLAVNLSVLVAIGLGSAISAPANPRILYVLLLTAVCSSPILKLERMNGEYFLLAVYSGVFYHYFAVSDLMLVLVGGTPSASGGVLTYTELIILAAVTAVVLGYHAAAYWLRRKGTISPAGEWSNRNMLAVGLTFWILGTVALLYWQTFVITDRTNASLVKNLNDLGPGLTTVFMMGQLIQPLGVLILAYAYAKYRRTFLLALIMLVVLVQVVLGFVADFKGEAMQAGILVIIVKTYVDGKPPKAWLLGAALFVVFAFPVFQAYRLQVRGEQGVTSLHALENLVATARSALQAQDKAAAGFGGSAYRTQSFWERSSLKPSVDLIVQRIGVDKPFEMGATLTPMVATFIPKILWPDKPSIAVGQVFNNEFHLAEPDTFISPSHVGELYWNFGWPGVVFGSAIIGLLLGVVGTRCGAFPQLSLTRLLIMVVTIYAFAIGSEGSIAVAYVPWLRSMAAIGILHWIFARRAGSIESDAAPAGRAEMTPNAAAAAAPFPQLLK